MHSLARPKGTMAQMRSDYEVEDEQTALIAGEERAYRSHQPVLFGVSLTSVQVYQVHSGTPILNLLCVILLIVASATGFVNVPLTRIVEDVICHQYYVNSLEEPIDEKLCKLEAIQSKVAFIFAITGMCEAVVALLAALPWGITADRIGRKPVFSTALVGMALGVLFTMMVLWLPNVFPTPFVALGSAFLLVGGGTAVVIGILLGMISDVIPEDKRATAFMRLHVSGLVGSLISPALSSAIMAVTGPWPVMLVAVACLMSGAIAILFVPETLRNDQRTEATGSENQYSRFDERAANTVGRLKESLSILASSSLLLLMVTCLFTAPFAIGVHQFLVQFVSKRYDMLIKNTGYVQAAYGLVQIIQALLVLPRVSSFLLKDTTPRLFKMANEQERDLTLAKFSILFLLLGFSALGAAPNVSLFILGLLILTFGSGHSSLIRSLMSFYVDPAFQSRLFSVICMIEVIGSFYGSPMMAGLFTLGLRLGGGWIGLPYYGLALLCAFCIGILFLVRVPKHAVSATLESEEAMAG
ncbi:hypothetical protein N7490_006335 [Penicillium lividum]|nr:hypothetical protein N7490_006335 [Penicillium lividum]